MRNTSCSAQDDCLTDVFSVDSSLETDRLSFVDNSVLLELGLLISPREQSARSGFQAAWLIGICFLSSYQSTNSLVWICNPSNFVRSQLCSSCCTLYQTDLWLTVVDEVVYVVLFTSLLGVRLRLCSHSSCLVTQHYLRCYFYSTTSFCTLYNGMLWCLFDVLHRSSCTTSNIGIWSDGGDLQ